MISKLVNVSCVYGRPEVAASNDLIGCYSRDGTTLHVNDGHAAQPASKRSYIGAMGLWISILNL